MNTTDESSPCPGASRRPATVHLAALGVMAGVLAGGADAQGSDASSQGSDGADSVESLPAVEVTGTATVLPHDIPQSIATVGADQISEQGIGALQDVLRNVPGITINAGEGGAHGDSVNLRGLSIPDSFFVDGVRDIGLYQRDTFDNEAVDVLLGPASVLFGRGSTAGVINQVTKQPTLSPSDSASVEVGTAGMERGTADLDWALGDHAALRINLMGQRTGVADRDYVENSRNGVAGALALGIDTPNTLSLSYLHQDENDIPDNGIPFIGDAPAQVDRASYYGLVNYDRTKSEVDLGTARFEHKFGSHASLVSSLRYAHYGFAYLLSAPHLDDDYTEPPAPGTPLSDILIYRDQPSSAGTESELISDTNLTTKFATAGVEHTLITGVEVGREVSDLTRFENGIDDIPPTPLLDPSPSYSPSTPLVPDIQPQSTGSDVSLSAMDSVKLGRNWDLDAGIRWDSFNTHYNESSTDSAYSRNDTEVSPRAAVVFKPSASQSYYASYGSSYNPAIEYLTLAPSSTSLSPEKDFTVETGARVDLAHGTVSVTGALFDTLLENARLADPDDPTIQEAPFDQRVLGAEVGISGHIAKDLELKASYTHLNDTIVGTTDPSALGKRVPNMPDDSASLWATWEPGRSWKLGGGATAMGQRYADTYNTAGVPAYVVLDAMASWKASANLDFQLNVNNIANKLYFNGLYYSAIDENHAVPGPGRTILLTARYRY